MLFAIPIREVSEWLKELAWKASIWVTVSRVRIPSSLLKQYSKGIKTPKILVFSGFFVSKTLQNIHSLSCYKVPNRDPNKIYKLGSR